jgi:hypothetical protein
MTHSKTPLIHTPPLKSYFSLIYAIGNHITKQQLSLFAKKDSLVRFPLKDTKNLFLVSVAAVVDSL